MQKGERIVCSMHDGGGAVVAPREAIDQLERGVGQYKQTVTGEADWCGVGRQTNETEAKGGTRRRACAGSWMTILGLVSEGEVEPM